MKKREKNTSPLLRMNKKSFLGRQIHDVKRDWQLLLMLLVPMIWLVTFKYWPMYGLQIVAFLHRALVK